MMQHENPEQRLLTIDDLAKRLCLSKRTIWRRLRDGLMLAPIEIGSTKRWDAEELDKWIQRGCPSREREGQ